MKKTRNSLLASLLLSIGLFGLLLFSTSRPEPKDDSPSIWAVNQGLQLEMKWLLDEEVADFATVQDTLSFYAQQLATINIPMRWQLNQCCGDQSLLQDLTGGPEAYQFTMDMTFPSENARYAAVELAMEKGFVQTDLKRLNFWEAEGSANLLLPIPGQKGRVLQINNSAVRITAAPQLDQPFPLS